ncbi:hypothetical protein Hanom_Chr03g00276271 [Helianthus anomalus]
MLQEYLHHEKHISVIYSRHPNEWFVGHWMLTESRVTTHADQGGSSCKRRFSVILKL